MAQQPGLRKRAWTAACCLQTRWCRALSVWFKPHSPLQLCHSARATHDLARMLQDMVLEQQGTLKEMLAAPNSHIYICGDSNMAAAVSAAFAGIIGGWLWCRPEQPRCC